MQLKDWPIGMGWLQAGGYAIKVCEPSKLWVNNKGGLKTSSMQEWFIPRGAQMFYIPRSLL